MPYTVTGEPGSGQTTDFSKETYDYDYPDGLDLRPTSDLHRSLKAKVLARARESHNEMTKRFPSWNEIDRVLTTYVPLSDKEKDIKDKDKRRPVSVVFPYTYAMLEALLTYISLAFFQDPIFQYEGVGPEDVRGSSLLELVVRIHCMKTKVPLALHSTFRNAFAYGIGPAAPGWERRYGQRPIKSSVILEGAAGTTIDRRVNWVDSLIFEGNSLSAIDPYNWLPDPSVDASNIQSGEFVGWMAFDNLMNMLAEEKEPENRMFNVRYLKAVRNKRSSFSTDQSDRNLKYGGQDPKGALIGSTNRVDNIHMHVNLIPREWELGASEVPEKWLFTLSADDIITSATRLDHAHGMYPVAMAAPEYDGISPVPIARLEILYGLQHILDFLFNTHIANVRKSINDMFVVDPYLININDLKDPEPGKLVRLRRPAWGRGVDKVVQQLQVNDITRNNIADSAYITQWMDRISGADQSMMGAQRQKGPERLTKGEFQGTRRSAVSRLQRLTMLIGLQLMQDIGYMFAVHTQQYLSKSTYVKIAGRDQERLTRLFGKTERIPVDIYDLAVDYDVIVRDGSIPGGNFSDVWIELYKIIATDPDLRREYDTFRIFEYIASELGAKNIQDFKRNVDQIQPTVQGDEEVLREAEKGNLVPLGA
jgi:hypothetical protein